MTDKLVDISSPYTQISKQYSVSIIFYFKTLRCFKIIYICNVFDNKRKMLERMFSINGYLQIFLLSVILLCWSDMLCSTLHHECFVYLHCTQYVLFFSILNTKLNLPWFHLKTQCVITTKSGAQGANRTIGQWTLDGQVCLVQHSMFKCMKFELYFIHSCS